MTTESLSVEKKHFWDLSSLALHILGMTFMLCDHLWATVIPGSIWLTCIGRLAYPIFAFLIVEGYHHTRNVKKYMKRLLLFALLSEIPFNLMVGGSVIYPFHQNVLFAFLLALLCLCSIDKVRKKCKLVPGLIFSVLIALGFILLGLITFVDYHQYGIMMVLLFYVFRGNKWYHVLGQAVGMVLINIFMIKGLNLPLCLFGMELEFPIQGFAVLSLPFIWCYRGRRGHQSKWIGYACYAFYPVHLLVLGLVMLLK